MATGNYGDDALVSADPADGSVNRSPQAPKCADAVRFGNLPWLQIVADSTPLPNDTISFPADFDASFCLGAFTAIIGLSGLSSGDGAPNFLHFCPPRGVTGVQYIRIFLKYVDDHPEKGHEIFPFVALNALLHAFPCKP